MEFVWSQEQATNYQEEGKTKEEPIFEKIRDLASNLVQGIVFKVDLPGRHPSGRVLMLDIEVWKETGGEGEATIRHSFYEKLSTCPLVFHRSEAVATRHKIVTLSEEVRRRMMNMDLKTTREERLVVLLCFRQKLVDSGYA